MKQGGGQARRPARRDAAGSHTGGRRAAQPDRIRGCVTVRRPMRVRFERLAATCAALVVFGSAQTAVHHLVAEEDRWRRPLSVLDSYRRVAEALPGWGRVGYLSTGEIQGLAAEETFVNAAYGVAPHVLVRGAEGVEHVVATFRSEGALEQLCRAHGLAPLVVDRGVALLGRARQD
jgi:hypothetical protein